MWNTKSYLPCSMPRKRLNLEQCSYTKARDE